MPRKRHIVPWGSLGPSVNFQPGNVATEHHPARAAAQTIAPVTERKPQLRQYRLAYNTVNHFVYCENSGKSGGVCRSALPINQIFKHLTETAVRATSDRVVHGYKILPSQRAQLELEIRQLYPRAPLTPADMQKVVPLPGQVGPIAGIADPVPGYICQVCHRGYTTTDSWRSHWKTAHRDIDMPAGDRVVRVPQMQSLSLHNNFIRYFAITPGAAEARAISSTVPQSEDRMLFRTLQEEVFGTGRGDVVELDSNAVLAFFRNSGAANHVEGLSPIDLCRLVESPRDDEPKLEKLRQAQNLRFKSYCSRVSRGSSALRRLMVITKP